MHTPTGENEYISVNVSLFVIYIMYKYPLHPRPCPGSSATTSPCNANVGGRPQIVILQY